MDEIKDYICEEYAMWRPADKSTWLLNPGNKSGLVWCCSECGHTEVGPWYDLPLQCPSCERAMIFWRNKV